MNNARTTDKSAVIKTALHQHLDGLTVLETQVPHKEHVPDGTPEPYITNGEINMTPRPFTPGRRYRGSQNFQVQIDSFSTYSGDKEIDALRNAIIGVLMDTMTVEAGYAITDRSLENSFTITEDGGNLRHGVVEARLALQIFP